MAVFTPCTTGTEALYRPLENADERELLAAPVEAWDEAGGAYVAGQQGLVPATTFRGERWTFLRLAPQLTWTGRPAEEAKRFPVLPANHQDALERPVRPAPPPPTVPGPAGPQTPADAPTGPSVDAPAGSPGGGS
jgi:hypothetical protein